MLKEDWNSIMEENKRLLMFLSIVKGFNSQSRLTRGREEQEKEIKA